MFTWSPRIMLRYALFQIPALALLILILALVHRWVNLPAWFIWGLIAIWIAKDIILSLFTWRAYDPNRKGTPNSIIGRRGVPENRLAPSGYVRVRGELWQAETRGNSSPIEKGESLRVYGNRGLILLVHRNNK